MKEQTVTFETAKIAKEKGFFKNPKEHGTYSGAWYNELGTFCGRSDLNKKGQTFKEAYPDYGAEYGMIPYAFKDEFSIETFYAPTQGLLQKWLRDKHNLDCIVSPWMGRGKTSGYDAQIRVDEAWFFIDNDFRTYEDALEKCLIAALQKISV